MIVASKLPPRHSARTYFNSGRAAFAFLIGQQIRPQRVYLPSYTCWSLVSTMQRRFPSIALEFYRVDRDLRCDYPTLVPGDCLVYIHFFGYRNEAPSVGPGVTICEDRSHAFLSDWDRAGHYVFGSLRKVMRIADGGFVDGFFNPIYEPSRKLDTWLRLSAIDWRDMREAENMMDREWDLCDISSQSLAILLPMDRARTRARRQANERFLATHLSCGRALRAFTDDEVPLLHQRLFDATDERDSLRQFLATRSIFCSIHWPTHPLVAASQADLGDTMWLEAHSLAIPVSDEYELSDMERIVNAVDEWKRAGA